MVALRARVRSTRDFEREHGRFVHAARTTLVEVDTAFVSRWHQRSHEPRQDFTPTDSAITSMNAMHGTRSDGVAELRARRSTANDGAEHDQAATAAERGVWCVDDVGRIRLQRCVKRRRHAFVALSPATSEHALGVSAISTQELGVPAGSPDGV
jgi:hypothetical protein